MTASAASPAEAAGRWRWLGGALLLTVWGLLLALCVGPPLVMFGGACLAREDGAAVLANVFGGGEWLRLLLSTLGVVGGTLLVALGLGLPAGLLCFRTDLPGRRLFVFAALLAACIPLYVTTLAWLNLLGGAFWMTLRGELPRVLGIAWIQGIAYTPLVALIAGLACTTASAEHEELALLETSRWGVLRRVTLRQALWGIGAAAVALTMLCFQDITVTDLLNVRTYPEATYVQFALHRSPWRGAATGLPVAVLLAALLAWLGWRLRHHAEWTAGLPPPPIRLRPWAKAVGLLLLAAIGLLPIVPLLGLVHRVGSLANFIDKLGGVGREMAVSLQVTPLAALLATVGGFVWAWLLVRHRASRRWTAPLLVVLLATPAPVLGMGFAVCFNRSPIPLWLYDSVAIVVLVHVARCLALTAIVMVPAIRALPTELEEAATLDGAAWGQRLWRIVLPLTWRHLLAAGALATILSLGEIGASTLVAPPGQSTLTVRFFTLVHYGAYADVAAICLAILLLVMLPAAAIAVAMHGWFRQRMG